MSEDKKKIEPGTHKVKVRNWGIRETEKGDLQVYVGFSNGATMFQMVNQNETGDEILARALTLCGFKGSDLPDLMDDDALDKNLDVEIFVKYSVNEKTGKEQMSVYVNDPGKKMKGSLDKKSAIAKLKELKLSLKKDLKDARSEIKIEKSEDSSSDMSESEENEEDIPF